MRDYFFALLIASVFGALCAAFAGARFEKQMRFIAALCLLAAALLPLKNVVPDLKELAAGEGGCSLPETPAADAFYAGAEDAAEEHVRALLYDRFGIKPRAVSINIDWDSETPEVTRVCVELPPGADVSAVKNYLDEELGGETEVVGE
ncbi:MAG: hypothetical protein J6252_05200 [Clostridia bacterium]|nr:hypothetical protein [Clostridia bacterium]